MIGTHTSTPRVTATAPSPLVIIKMLSAVGCLVSPRHRLQWHACRRAFNRAPRARLARGLVSPIASGSTRHLPSPSTTRILVVRRRHQLARTLQPRRCARVKTTERRRDLCAMRCTTVRFLQESLGMTSMDTRGYLHPLPSRSCNPARHGRLASLALVRRRVSASKFARRGER